MFTEEHFHKLFKFETDADSRLFIDIFGGIGEHLWDKFEIDCKHKIISFYRTLDPDNFEKLISHLNETF